MEALGSKYANMLLLMKYLDPLVPKENIALSPITCNGRSNNLGYLFSCKTCSKQYTGNTESFRSRFNNYKSAHKNFIKGNTVKQVSFNAHVEDDQHHGVSDWESTVIGQAEGVDDLRRRVFLVVRTRHLSTNWTK